MPVADQQNVHSFSSSGIPVDYDLKSEQDLLATFLSKPHEQEIARQFLQKFKTIDNVMRASFQELKSITAVDDIDIIRLRSLPLILYRVLKESFMRQSITDVLQPVIRYYQIRLGYKITEFFCIMYLDADYRIIDEEILQEGSINQAPTYTREILTQALHYNAYAVVITHNHPSGNPQPSNADINFTEYIQIVLQGIQLELYDHLVITTSSYTSLRSLYPNIFPASK